MPLYSNGKGRPCPLTIDPTLAPRIIYSVARGNYINTAAAIAGVDQSTIHRWIRRGKEAWHAEIEGNPVPQSEIPYYELCKGVQTARAQAEADALEAIQDAGNDPAHWQAKAWYLERCYGARYGRKDTLRVEAGYIALQDVERLLAGLATIAQEMRDAAEAHTDPMIAAALCEQHRDYVARITDLAQELADRMPGRPDADE